MLNSASVCPGEESGEEGQQDGVQGRESPTGEADVEPEDKHSGPEALAASTLPTRTPYPDSITAFSQARSASVSNDPGDEGPLGVRRPERSLFD